MQAFELEPRRDLTLTHATSLVVGITIGTGVFQQSAARLTHFYGALVLAQTVNPATHAPLGTPGTPTLDWLSGTGNPNLQYDSCLVTNAQPAITYKPLSFREISQ